MASHTIVVASLWTFFDAQSFIQRFEQSTGDSLVRCVYDELKNQFVIKCKPEEEEKIGAAFSKALYEYVRGELKKETASYDDPFDRPQVERMPELKPFIQASYFERARYRSLEPEDPPPTSVGETSVGEKLINHESVATTVKPDVDEHLAKLSIFNDNVLTTLGTKTHCRIEWRNDTLKLWAETRDDLEAAVDRIHRIQSHNVESISRRRVYDLYSSPGLPGHKLRFSFCATVVDQSLLKTDENFATQYYDLRAVVWDTKSLQFLSVLGESSVIRYPKDITNPWSKPVIFAYGDKSKDPKYWTHEGNVSQQPLASRLSPTKLSRVTHWAQEVDHAQNPTLLSGLAKNDIFPQEIPRQTRRGQIEVVGPNGQKCSSEQPDLLCAQESSLADRAPVSCINEEATHLDLQVTLRDQGHRKPLVEDEKLTVTDMLQLEDTKEQDTGFRRFIPLKAGAKSEDNRASPMDLLSLAQKAMTEILASLELHSFTKSGVELQIGQIFTKATSVPRKFQCIQGQTSEPFPREDWGLIYTARSNEGKATTIFSQKITGAWEDAYCITNLPHPTRRHMFDKIPVGDVSTYRLLCLNEKTGDQAFIEISSNADGVRICPTSQEAGAVNLHFPRHIWDLRFVTVGEAPLSNEVIQPLRTIANNLWIHAVEDAKNPQIERLYSKKPEPHISILAVELRKEMIYNTRGTGKDISLHLTRVEDLKISELPGGFCASSAREEIPLAHTELWEAKLLSAELNKIVKESQHSDDKTMEAWAESSRLKDAVCNLLGCGDLIIRSINDVGHSSRKKVTLSRPGTKGSTKKGQSTASVVPPPVATPRES